MGLDPAGIVYSLAIFMLLACKKVQENLGKEISVPLSAGKTGLNMFLCSRRAVGALAVYLMKDFTKQNVFACESSHVTLSGSPQFIYFC